MRSLFDLDKAQLNRIEADIAAFECWPPAERQKSTHLLQALKSEKQELMQYDPAIRRAAALKAA